MTQVLIGQISDGQGFARSFEPIQASHPGRTFDIHKTHWACPSTSFRATQPACIPLEAGHHGGPQAGTVEHLEHRHGRLWVVAETADGYDLSRQPWQLSYDLTEADDGFYDLRAVAVVARSATLGLPVIETRDGKLWQAARATSNTDGVVRDLIRNANRTQRTRNRGPIRVLGLQTPEEEEAAMHAKFAERYYRDNPHKTPRHERGQIEHSPHRGKVLRVS